tara:strand:- start:636 stop:779 length:144 start_codon:yes stop_codon:yes gene_type:complete
MKRLKTKTTFKELLWFVALIGLGLAGFLLIGGAGRLLIYLLSKIALN